MNNGTLTGNIVNAGTGTLTGNNNGIFLENSASISGTITNNNTITGTSFDGVLLANASVAGVANNAGTISGNRAGIRLEASASITTNGITNASGATISGNVDGIEVNAATVTGGIDNDGTISGGTNAINIVSPVAPVTVTNSGTLTGNVVLADGTLNLDNASASVSGTVTGDGSSKVDIQAAFTTSNTMSIGTLEVDDGITFDMDHDVTAATAFTVLGTGSVDNAATITGTVGLNNGTLNLLGGSARVNGAVSGTASSTVSVQSDFTTENTFNVGTFQVTSGNTLTMSHNITAQTAFNNAGTVGVATGTSRTITGDYTQQAGGDFEIGATSNSNYGQLTVSGTADLSADNSISVDVAGGNTLSAGDTLTAVLSAGTLTASSISVTDNSALLGFRGTINGNQVDLSVIQAGAIADSVDNERRTDGYGNAAVTLDDLNTGSPSSDMQEILDEINGLSTDAAVSDAVEQLSPVLNSGHAQSNIMTAQAGGTNVVRDRMTRLAIPIGPRSASAQLIGVDNSLAFAGTVAAIGQLENAQIEEFARLNAALSLDAAAIEPAAGPGHEADTYVWFKPFGANTKQGSRNGVSGFGAISKGIAIGADTMVAPALRVGGALSFADADVESNNTDSEIGVKTLQATFYGNYDLAEDLDLGFLAGAGWNYNQSERNINFGAVDRTARADYSSVHLLSALDLSWQKQVDEYWTIIPSASANYTFAYADSYEETGAGAANLSVGSSNVHSLDFGATVRVVYQVNEAFSLSAYGGARYDVLADNDQVEAAFAEGGANFVSEGVEPEALGGVFGAAVDIVNFNGIELTLGYDLSVKEDFTNHSASVNVRIPFPAD